MKTDYPELKKEWIQLVLLGVSAVFAVLIVVKTAGFFAEPARAEGLVKRAVGQNGSDDKQIEGAIARSCAVADELKRANLFSPPEPRRHPVTAVTGILGDEVLIGDKWYKAGDSVQDARIVAVEATQVRIEWDGREKIFSPLGTTVQSDSGGSRRTSRSSRAAARTGRTTSRPPQMVTVGGGSPGGGISAEEMKKLREKAQKQRQAIIDKELQRASKVDAKKREPDKKKKKSPDEIRKAKEKSAEKKARKLARK